MSLYDDKLYMDDVRYVAELPLDWQQLEGCNLLISGASGMIGSFLIDVLLYKDIDCHIYAIGRSLERFNCRFKNRVDDGRLHFVAHDINEPLSIDLIRADFILHLASNTHPVQYATDPIGTITTNVLGALNMLDFAVNHYNRRFLFASSNEIYGENRGDKELFSEDYCGYIDCNSLRAGYPESKRCSEALCQAYAAKEKLNVVIARFTRSYGPTMLDTDTKAISQFIKKAVQGENIILKSTGNQYYSYQYVADSVSGLLTLLLCGETGEAYNIAAENSDITLKDLAEMLAETGNGKVVYELPDAIEAAGYSKATKARLDGTKLLKLGWRPRYGIREGIKRTVAILRELNE